MNVAPVQVHCVNCTAGGTDWPTVLALVLAGIAAAVAGWSLWIQSADHRRLLAELAKRADFELTIIPTTVRLEQAFLWHVESDSADLRIPADWRMVEIVFQIGITNTGARAAQHTLLHVLASHSGTDRLRWCDANGTPLEGAVDVLALLGGGVALSEKPTAEAVEGEDRPDASRWIDAEIDRVALRTPRVRYFSVRACAPAGYTPFRVRLKAQSDDLPDEVVERTKDYLVRISRTETPRPLDART